MDDNAKDIQSIKYTPSGVRITTYTLRCLDRWYAERLLDIYGMLAMDVGLTVFQAGLEVRLQHIIHRSISYSQSDIEMIFEDIATDLEARFAETESEGE